MTGSYWESPDAALSRSLSGKKVTKMMLETMSTRHDDETILGKTRWTEEDQKNARRVCPTCGTPACNHPDRIRGEDALPIPPEALIAGREALGRFLPHRDWQTVEMIAESLFRTMLEKCSK